MAVIFSPTPELYKVYYILYQKNSYLMNFTPIDLGLPYVFQVYNKDIVLTEEKLRFSTWLSFKELSMGRSQISRRNIAASVIGEHPPRLWLLYVIYEMEIWSYIPYKICASCKIHIRHFWSTFHSVTVLFHLSIIHCFFIRYLWYHYVGQIMLDVTLRLSVQEIISHLHLDFWK